MVIIIVVILLLAAALIIIGCVMLPHSSPPQELETKLETKPEITPVKSKLIIPRDLLEKTIRCTHLPPREDDSYFSYKANEDELLPLIRKDLLELIGEKEWDEITATDIRARAKKMAIEFFYLSEKYVLINKHSGVKTKMTLGYFTEEITRCYLNFCYNICEALKVTQNSKED